MEKGSINKHSAEIVFWKVNTRENGHVPWREQPLSSGQKENVTYILQEQVTKDQVRVINLL